MSEPFTWVDGERLIRYGAGAAEETPALLAERGFDRYALMTTARAQAELPSLAEGADVVVHVPAGPVPEAAAAVRGRVGERPLVALGGGRVVDSAKAIGAADGLEVAALPTTLSGAELTRFHRMPSGVEGVAPVRPSLVVADPRLMASQPMPDLAASAMNAMAHAIEALYTPLTNPAAQLCGLRAVELLADGVSQAEPDRERLALGGLLAGWASGSAGYAFIHVLCQTTVRIAGTPHAATYAVLLPHGLRLLESRVPDLLGAVAAALGAADAQPELAAVRAAELGAHSQHVRLSALGVAEGDIEAIADGAAQRAELQNTPLPPGREELAALLAAAL